MRIGLTAPTTLPRLSSEAELALFRALQEALSNAARHSSARTVTVALTVRDAQAVLDVRDDGVGMDDATRARLSGGPGRSGLIGMRERVAAAGGSVTLSPSTPGLRIVITIPTRRA